MTILPLNLATNATPEALLAFLGECRAGAVRDGHPKLVSISLAVDALDPLAVLESIFEPDEPHFYAERPSLESAIAGAEIATAHEASGAARFASVQRWIDQTLAHTIAVGDVEAPFGGPHFFAGFTFSDEVDPGEPFPPAFAFVPRWQVSLAGTTTTAVANLLVTADADVAVQAERVWRAHAKFRHFEYAGGGESGTGGLSGTDVPAVMPGIGSGTGVPPVISGMGGTSMPHSVQHGRDAHAATNTNQEHARDARATSEHGRDAHATAERQAKATFTTREAGDYRAAVARALELISVGELNKIVLARAQDLTASQPLHPLRMLNGLRQRFPDCYAFSLAHGRGRSFIGASPERLVRVSRGSVETEALAGSMRRGATASEDAALAAALLRSEKDVREHREVIDDIVARLKPLGLQLEYAEQPQLRRLANVQHLHTPVRAALPEGVRLLDIVAAMHPTPAVGGNPRQSAVARIRELEGFARGLYAGALGWLNARGGGEFFVGIRSALVEGASARVFAGAGIVAGSTPEKEFAETELKFKAMLEALVGQE
ncbi:MAG: isochorismate synthase [Opitutaceae bacterium]|nr:isochorismate synthase [Opitutaceae bacterium]